MSEWGKLLEHDGKGCPCIGRYVEAHHDDGDIYYGIAGSDFDGTENWTGSSWHWGLIETEKWTKIIRYRIRRPLGLTILTDILREVENTKQPEYTN